MQRRLGLAIFLVLLALPLAEAQGELTQPIQGSYQSIYLVTGRVIDALGAPVVGGELTITLQMAGVKAEPLAAKTDCFGLFITYFGVRHVDTSGRVTIKLKGVNGGPDASATVGLDPFWRRSDANITYQGQWPSVCPDQTNLWPQRVSVSGRILNRTDRYQQNGTDYDAVPATGYVRLRLWSSNSSFECPPADTPGLCEPIKIDSRGDFRYSWVAPKPRDAVGHVEVLYGNASYNMSVDKDYRYALMYVEATGRGVPLPDAKKTPAPEAMLALACVGAAALALSKRRRG